MKKFKILKLFLVYGTLIALFGIFCEFLSYNFIYGNLPYELRNLRYTGKANIYFEKLTYTPQIRGWSFEGRKRLENKNIPFDSHKRPILTLGCSYMYGQGIKENKTFYSQLQNITKRKVDNISELGFGPDDIYHHILYTSNHGILSNNQYEYVIYTLMYNHILRVHIDTICRYLNIKYERNKNKSLKDKLIYYADKLYTVNLILGKIFIKDEKNLFEYNNYILLQIFECIKKEIPDIKCIFLIYDDVTNYHHEGIEADSLKKEAWKDLEDIGVIIISTKDLVGDVLYKDEYKLKHDPFQEPHHPNEKAWEHIVPPLIKYLNI